MASRDRFPVKEAVELLDKFSCGKLCLDDFIEDTLQDLESQGHPQTKFLLDAVSGCVEQKTLLDVVVNGFCGQHGKHLSRRDRNQFVMICYLATFALEDLGVQRFGSIVKSLDVKMMHTFLGFFFSNLTMYIQDEWNSLYDSAFVEKEWIGPLLRWRPEINILVEQLAVQHSQGNQMKRAPIKTTEPQEFSLTRPKPRLPQPELIPQPEKAKPVPNSTYRAPSEMQIIKDSKLKNRQKAEELLNEANWNTFRCANLKKSAHTQKVLSQIEEDLKSKLKFDSFHSSGPPSGEKDNSCPVKLNKAAKLRMKVLYERQMKEEERAERQKDTPDTDLQQMLTWRERRHLEERTSDMKAALARQQLTERNQKTVQREKDEAAQRMQRCTEKRLQEQEALRELVKQVAGGNKNSREAKEKLQKLKQGIVKEVSEQSQELLRQTLEEAQAELSRKYQIIREIHSMESISCVKIRAFDDTETAGHRLMEKMSLVELRECLVLLRETQRTEQEEKRREILEKKKQLQVEEELQDLLELHQRKLARAGATRKEERKARLEFCQQAVAQDEGVVTLKEELQQLKREHQKLKQTQSTRSKPQSRQRGTLGRTNRRVIK